MRKALVCLSLAWLLIGATAWAGNYKVLVLVGDARTQEPPIVEGFTQVGPHTFEFEEVVIEGVGFDGDLRGADIIWFPWNGPGHDGNYFMDGTEDVIREFVKNGGAVWISAFDDNYRDPNGNQVGGWLPIDEHPVTVMNTGDSNVEITPEGEKSGLFSNPNQVDMNAITLDDNFAGLDDSWVVLATRTDNKEPAATYLEYGKGIYLEVCADSRDGGRAAAMTDLIENGLLFLANWVETALPVAPAGKLATTWGTLKL